MTRQFKTGSSKTFVALSNRSALLYIYISPQLCVVRHASTYEHYRQNPSNSITRRFVEKSTFRRLTHCFIWCYGYVKAPGWNIVQPARALSVCHQVSPPTDIITLVGYWCIILVSGERIRRKEGMHSPGKSLHLSCLRFSLRHYFVRSITRHFSSCMMLCNYSADLPFYVSKGRQWFQTITEMTETVLDISGAAM